ncbi:MAG: methyltransferase, CheR-type [Gemmatimonadetes bacterium]|nr:methyltransferase, CheR-type [Gemmatimonadota bacterium]
MITSGSALGALAFPLVADTLRQRSGLTFGPGRRAAVETALGRVMQRNGLRDPASLVSLLASDGDVFDEVMAVVTVGETYFFREPAQLEWLRTTAIPALLAGSPARPLRLWSAACATGEEAYSLAITCLEAGVQPVVLGTDVSRGRLTVAARGRYREWSMRGVPPATIDRYFRRVDGEFCLHRNIRALARFASLNLVSDRYPDPARQLAGFDVIFCRNVLIYFDAPAIASVASRLLASLSPDGWLLLGASDPPLAHLVECEAVQTSAGVAYRRPREGRAVAPPLAIVAPWVPPTPAVVDVEPVRDMPAPVAEVVVAPRAPVAHPENREAMTLAVRALANAGQLEEADRLSTRALELHPDAAELHYLRSLLLLQAGHSQAALAAARSATYLDRTLVAAQLVLADALMRQQDVDAARRVLSAAEAQLRDAPASVRIAPGDDDSVERMLAHVRARRQILDRTVAS